MNSFIDIFDKPDVIFLVHMKKVLSHLLNSMVIPWGLQPHDPLIKSQMGIIQIT